MNNLYLKTDWQRDYYQYLIDKGLSNSWLKEHKRAIFRLGKYLEKKKIKDLNKIIKQDLLGFQEYLYRTYRIRKPTMRMKVVVIRVLFGYLYHKGLITSNPAYNLEILNPPDPRLEKSSRYYNWDELKKRWIHNLRLSGHCWGNIKQKLFSLEQFLLYLEERGIKTIYKVHTQEITSYENYLRDYQLPTGGKYREFCILQKLRHIDQFFRFIAHYSIIPEVPTKNVDFSRYRQLVEEEKRKKKEEPVTPEKTKLELLTERYISWRLSQGYRYDTRQELRKFLRFLLIHSIQDFSCVTKKDILEYQDYLFQYRTRQGKPYCKNSIKDYMTPIFSLFRFLTTYDFILKDPTSSLSPPKEEKGLPRTLMTPKEVQKMLDAPDILTPIGIRDRTMMEVFYSTGIRANELANLKIEDIDFATGLIRVTHPKGGPSYERVVPIGVIACEWIRRYISESRPLLNTKNLSYLFLSINGNKLDANAISFIISDYRLRLGIKKKITSHSFRVTCATLMLKNKADIRYIQEQLGHRSIVSTQIYTRLIPQELKEIHSKCHPREREAKGLEPVIDNREKTIDGDNKKELNNPTNGTPQKPVVDLQKKPQEEETLQCVTEN